MSTEETIPEILKQQPISSKKLQWPLHYYATKEDLENKDLWFATSGRLEKKYPTPIYFQFIRNQRLSTFHGKPKGRYYLAWRG